ncbi:MAG: hypothetical protein EBR71_08985 [Planctomycetes bacterium]|nr:hypothetical protein [Planctomycetota bacterium]
MPSARVWRRPPRRRQPRRKGPPTRPRSRRWTSWAPRPRNSPQTPRIRSPRSTMRCNSPSGGSPATPST